VTIQFAAIGIIIWSSRTPFHNPAIIILLLLSITLGVWAIVSMKIRNLKVFPEPKNNAEFIAAGPYRFIRHPMYTSVLLLTLSYVLKEPGFGTIVTWIILIGDLLLKLHYEEGLLNDKFPNYRGYTARTKRLIPFLY
jgi:protein-S-isoprenylcysteine O-methyltransferase Ste14